MRKSWTLSLVTPATGALGVAKAGMTPASAAPNTPLRVMPLGDSITWGEGSSTGNGYRGPLWDKLAADGHPLDFVGTLQGGSMSDPDNEGHCGYRIDQITAAVPDATVLVASLVVSTSGAVEQYRATYNRAVPHIVSEAQAAGKHVAYVDMSSLATADLADTLHPNDMGYEKIADAFHRGIQAADSAGWLRNTARPDRTDAASRTARRT